MFAKRLPEGLDRNISVNVGSDDRFRRISLFSLVSDGMPEDPSVKFPAYKCGLEKNAFVHCLGILAGNEATLVARNSIRARVVGYAKQRG
ncbi:unnamed protein product [Rhodiola kirilowii]